MLKEARYSYLYLFFFVIYVSYLPPCAGTDTTESHFFSDIENTIRSDYRLCTGDSTAVSIRELIEWRRSLDSIIESALYPEIVREFTRETGIAAADARPCEIIKWMKSKELERQETGRYLSDERRKLLEQYSDSVYLLHELAGVKRAAYDLASIPFGLSRRSVIILARRSNFSPDEGSESMPVVCSSVPLGMMSFKAAFHFTKDNRYWCYELESGTCGLDSLDSYARSMMDYLAAYMEKSTSQPPAHIYRVGMLDIVPGKLSICKLWDFESAVAYIGLAREKNRFYAKAIVKLK